MSGQTSSKYVPYWKQAPGKVTKTDKGVLIHPHDLIALVHKKKGLEEASKLALKLLEKKYDRLFESAKESNKDQ